MMLKLKISLGMVYIVLAGCAANSPQNNTSERPAHQTNPLHDDGYVHSSSTSRPSSIEELEIVIYPQRIDEEGYTVKVDVD